MKISIITVDYKSGRIIGDTINSVFNQKYPNKKNLIIDVASKDNTVNKIDDNLNN